MLVILLALGAPASGSAHGVALEKHQLRQLCKSPRVATQRLLHTAAATTHICAPPPAITDDLGQDITLCWATSSGTSAREDCAGAYMEFTYQWPAKMTSDREYPITFRMHVPPSRGVVDAAVPHANLHSCLRNNIFCTPFVANTPTLATHAPALSGTLISTS